MACQSGKVGDATVIICGLHRSTQRCKFCGKPATKLCDFPLHGPKQGLTCSIPMCDQCATAQGEGIDFCPAHQRHVEKLKEQKAG